MIQVKMTPEQYAAKAQELYAQQGIALAGKSGTLVKDGISATYSYDGEVLTVSVVKRPFYLSEAVIEEKLTEWLAE